MALCVLLVVIIRCLLPPGSDSETAIAALKRLKSTCSVNDITDPTYFLRIFGRIGA